MKGRASALADPAPGVPAEEDGVPPLVESAPVSNFGIFTTMGVVFREGMALLAATVGAGLRAERPEELPAPATGRLRFFRLAPQSSSSSDRSNSGSSKSYSAKSSSFSWKGFHLIKSNKLSNIFCAIPTSHSCDKAANLCLLLHCIHFRHILSLILLGFDADCVFQRWICFYEIVAFNACRWNVFGFNPLSWRIDINLDWFLFFLLKQMWKPA